MAIKESAPARNAKLTALATYIGIDAVIEVRSGVRPANPATAASGSVLATLAGNHAAFGVASAGVLTAAAITSATAVANGTASWFRMYKSDGVTVCIDGDVGAGSGDLSLPGVAISFGQIVSCNSMTITDGNA